MTLDGLAAAIFYLLTTDYWAVALSQTHGTCCENCSVKPVLHNAVFLWLGLKFLHISDPGGASSEHMAM